MDKQEKICRLCLKNCDGDFKVIAKNATDILVFLLKINLFINEESVMCTNCAENIKDCSDFKRICLDVKDSVVELINHSGQDQKLNGANEDGHKMCRLCMGSLNLSLKSKLKDVSLDQVMLNKCLPELDLLHVTEKPTICVPCRVSLQRYFSLITNFSIVEEKIKKYCEAACIDPTGPIGLKNVLEFATKNTLGKVESIKIEDKFCGNEYVDEQKCSDELYPSESLSTNTDAEEVDRIKIEETFCEEIDCKIELKREDLMKMEGQQSNDIPKFRIKREEDNGYQVNVIEMKQSYCQELINKLEPGNFNSFQDGDISPQMDTKFNSPKLQECSSTQPHRTPPQVLFVKSDKKAKMHQCERCSFETRYKGSLKTHLKIHKSSSETTMYRCELCSFQSKYKSSQKIHMLSHRNLTEVTTYQCEQCSFRTKYKSYMNGHLLTHKKPSETTMYQCQRCTFQTKYKNSLETHLLTHKNSSEITLYRCEKCSFHTKFKHYLKQHLLIHKDPSEITMYQCVYCSRQIKRKTGIKKHLQRHENRSEITMYKCAHCSFQAKLKRDLKKHLVSHKKSSETVMSRCKLCSFQTKYLKAHMLIHENSSERFETNQTV